MSSADLAKRIALEHEQRSNVLSRLEEELNNNNHDLQSTTSPLSPSYTHHQENYDTHEDEEEQQQQQHHHQEDYTADNDYYDQNNATPQIKPNPSPPSARASPRYAIPTTASRTREQDSASKSLAILRRKHTKAEKNRVEMIIRKGQISTDLERALKSLQHSQAKQNILTHENDTLRAQLAAAKQDAAQLRQAMVHSAQVMKESQQSSSRRWKESENRVRVANEQISSMRETNQRLLHYQEARTHDKELIVKLEEDKSKLEVQLTRTRRSLTSERNQSSEMSKMRYDLELLKAEKKDMKRMTSNSSRALLKCREELDACRDALTQAEARLNGKERMDVGRTQARLQKIELHLRTTRADSARSLARMNTLLSISVRPMLTSNTIYELGSAIEVIGCQTLNAERCELWMCDGINTEETTNNNDNLKRLVTTSTLSSVVTQSPSSSSSKRSKQGSTNRSSTKKKTSTALLDTGMTERDLRDLMRRVLVSRETTQRGPVLLSPVYGSGHRGTPDVIGVLWCVRNNSSTSTSSSKMSSVGSDSTVSMQSPSKMGRNGVFLTPSTKTFTMNHSSSGGKKKNVMYDKTDLLCIQQLASSTSVGYAYTKTYVANRESMNHIRTVLHEVQHSANISKTEMMTELARLQEDHANVSGTVYILFLFQSYSFFLIFNF